jgi:hypothetical protein
LHSAQDRIRGAGVLMLGAEAALSRSRAEVTGAAQHLDHRVAAPSVDL